MTVGSLIDPLFGPFFSIKMSLSKSFIRGRKTTMWLCSAFSALLVRPANRLLSRLPLLIATDNTVFALWHLCQSVYKEPSELPGFLPYNARRVYTRGCRAGAPVWHQSHGLVPVPANQSQWGHSFHYKSVNNRLDLETFLFRTRETTWRCFKVKFRLRLSWQMKLFLLLQL